MAALAGGMRNYTINPQVNYYGTNRKMSWHVTNIRNEPVIELKKIIIILEWQQIDMIMLEL